MSVDVSYEGNIGIIKMVAGRVYRRCLAARLSLDMDDCIQEMTIAWIKASRNFDESRGFKFTTYYMRVAYQHFNKVIEKEENSTINLNTTTMYEDEVAQEAADEVSPDAMMHKVMAFTNVSASLSGPAALIVKWVIDPPGELIEEIALKKRKSEYIRSQSQGNGRSLDGGISIGVVTVFVAKLLELNKGRVQRVRNELKDLQSNAL